MTTQDGGQFQKIFLNPGELILSESPVIVTTVLGSCLAITLFAGNAGLSSICHAVLPSGGDKNPGKYVDQSLKYMIAFFKEHRIRRSELEVKVFGGADMFPVFGGKEGQSRTIGSQNVAKARECLVAAGLKTAAVDVGGTLGRKLIFHSVNGNVFVKRIKREQFAENSSRLDRK